MFRKRFTEHRYKAVAEDRRYMLERENKPLSDGTAMPLVRALLTVNKHKREVDTPLVEVVIMPRNLRMVRYALPSMRIGVLFDERSDIVHKAEGLNGFHAHEDSNQDVPMPKGPYPAFLEKLSKSQKRLPFPVEFSPVRIARVAARNAPAELRVIKTL